MEESKETSPVVFSPYGLAVIVVVVTIIGSAFLTHRKGRERRTQARCHFVKAASFYNEAQKAKIPSAAQSLAHQAIVEVDVAIQLEGRDASFHILKSLALEVAGSSKDAVKELGRALASPRSLSIPERSSILIKRAELLLSQSEDGGHLQEALVDLRKSVALTPKDPRARVLLGEAYEKNGNVSKAIEAFNEAAVLDPKSPDAKAALERLQVS